MELWGLRGRGPEFLEDSKTQEEPLGAVAGHWPPLLAQQVRGDDNRDLDFGWLCSLCSLSLRTAAA